MKLILLPGLDGTGKLFQPLLNLTPEGIYPLVVTYPNQKLTFGELAKCVVNQLPNDEPITVLAESFAGPLLLHIIKNYSLNIQRVIFCATFARNPRPLLLNTAKYLPLRVLLKMPIPRFVLKWFCIGQHASSDLVELVQQAIQMVSSDVLASRLEVLANIDEREALGVLNAVPCCYLIAENDQLVPKTCMSDFMVIPKLKVFRIPAGHFVLQAKPKECWREIIHFLEEIQKPL